MKKFFGLMVFLVGFSSSVFAEGWQEPTLPLNIAIEGEDDGSRIYLRSENSKNPDNCKDWAYARIYGVHFTFC